MRKFRGELFTVLALPILTIALVVAARAYFEQSIAWTGDPTATYANFAPIS